MNRDLIAERCQAAGLSTHQLAQQASIDPVILWNRPNDPTEDRIPLGTLRTLSRLLDLTLDELLEEPSTPPHTPSDDLRIEAALAQPPGSFSRDDLAGALEWTLERVDRALNALELRLRPTGRRLRIIGQHRYTLGPNQAILTATERARLARTNPHRLTHQDYETLYQIIDGWKHITAFRLDTERTALNTLTTHGLIQQNRAAIELAADVTFSLRLESTDTPVAPGLTNSRRTH